MHRHTRHIRLAEVGESGQARLAAGEVHVRSRGLAGAIAARYLEGAGVAALCVADTYLEGAGVAALCVADTESARVAPGVGGIADPAARAVAEGAHEALVAMRVLLGMESPS